MLDREALAPRNAPTWGRCSAGPSADRDTRGRRTVTEYVAPNAGPATVELPLRVTLEPTPVEGCGVCSALSKQRHEARADQNMSRVSDCNVELRNHPHPQNSRRALAGAA